MRVGVAAALLAASAAGFSAPRATRARSARRAAPAVVAMGKGAGVEHVKHGVFSSVQIGNVAAMAALRALVTADRAFYGFPAPGPVGRAIGASRYPGAFAPPVARQYVLAVDVEPVVLEFCSARFPDVPPAAGVVNQIAAAIASVARFLRAMYDAGYDHAVLCAGGNIANIYYDATAPGNGYRMVAPAAHAPARWGPMHQFVQVLAGVQQWAINNGIRFEQNPAMIGETLAAHYVANDYMGHHVGHGYCTDTDGYGCFRKMVLGLHLKDAAAPTARTPTALVWVRDTNFSAPLGIAAGAAGLPVFQDVFATYQSLSRLFANKFAGHPSRLGLGTWCLFLSLCNTSAAAVAAMAHGATDKVDLAENWVFVALFQICTLYPAPPAAYRNDIIGKLEYQRVGGGAWPPAVAGRTAAGDAGARDIRRLYCAPAFAAQYRAELRACKDWSAAQIK